MMEAVKYLGWVFGEAEDVPRLHAFGFTGRMIPNGKGKIEYVDATPEIMEKACKKWRNFNWRSFTAVDAEGNQLPSVHQFYWTKGL